MTPNPDEFAKAEGYEDWSADQKRSWYQEWIKTPAGRFNVQISITVALPNKQCGIEDNSLNCCRRDPNGLRRMGRENLISPMTKCTKAAKEQLRWHCTQSRLKGIGLAKRTAITLQSLADLLRRPKHPVKNLWTLFAHALGKLL